MSLKPNKTIKCYKLSLEYNVTKSILITKNQRKLLIDSAFRIWCALAEDQKKVNV